MSGRYADLREEHAREIVGERWLAEVRRVSREVVTTYAPDIYANGLSWDDELDDLVQEVIVDRLLRERQIDYVMAVASDLADVRRLVARQVRITLAHRRRRTVVDQLITRARSILGGDGFVQVADHPARWTLTDRSTEDRSPTAAELRLAERRVRSIPTVSGRGDERAPMVYRTDDLATLLRVVAETLPTPVGIGDLDRILRSLLTPFLPGILHESGAGLSAPDDDEETNVAAALRLVQELSDEQRMILAGKLSGAADADIAAAASLSRPTIAKRRVEVYDVVRSVIGGLSVDRQRSVLDRVGAALAGYWPAGGGAAQ